MSDNSSPFVPTYCYLLAGSLVTSLSQAPRGSLKGLSPVFGGRELGVGLIQNPLGMIPGGFDSAFESFSIIYQTHKIDREPDNGLKIR